MTDFDKGYKQGVTDALDLPIMSVTVYTSDFLRNMIEEHRKNLLTKQTTKYFFLYKSGYEDFTVPTRTSNFYDTEEAARKASLDGQGEIGADVLSPKIFAIQIESLL